MAEGTKRCIQQRGMRWVIFGAVLTILHQQMQATFNGKWLILGTGLGFVCGRGGEMYVLNQAPSSISSHYAHAHTFAHSATLLWIVIVGLWSAGPCLLMGPHYHHQRFTTAGNGRSAKRLSLPFSDQAMSDLKSPNWWMRFRIFCFKYPHPQTAMTCLLFFPQYYTTGSVYPYW